MIKNKKGESKILTFWLFVIWGLILVAIVAGVFIFYSSNVDVRKAEANILATRIIDCLIDDGYLREDFSSSFNIFKNCNLNEKVINAQITNYFIKIEIPDKGIIIETLRKSFETECELPGKNFPECEKKEVTATDSQNNPIQIKILTASNNNGEKVKLIQ